MNTKTILGQLSWVLGALTMVAALAPIPSALADRIETGIGVHTAFDDAGANLLLQVKVQDYYFYLSAQVATEGELQDKRFPYLNVRFAPVEIDLPGTESDARLQFVPIGITRNESINQQTSFSISAVGFNVPARMALGSWGTLFARVAIDMIGYKVKNYLDGVDAAKLFHVAGTEFEVALIAELSSGFNFIVSLGGEADFNYGSSRGTTSQADLGAYVQVAAEVDRFMRLWVKMGVVGAADVAQIDDWKSSPLLTAGVTFTMF